MPKRSAAEKIELYERKIKKLRDKEQNKRRRVRVISSDSSDNEGTEVNRPTTMDIDNPLTVAEAPAVMLPATPASAPQLDPVPEPEAELLEHESLPEPEPEVVPERAPSTSALEEQPSTAAVVAETTSEPPLDPELLEALGESTGDMPEYGPNIQENLAKLWLPLLKKGMSKDNKEKLMKEYLIPDNCRLLQSPKLNAEISAAVLEGARNRDKGLISQQQQLGAGITAVNRSLDLLLRGDDKKLTIRHLSNACRILSDLHATFTQNRIKLITPGLDKSFLHIIQDSERDDTLFGNKLPEKIKAAKAIERQGQQIKKVNNQKAPNTSHSTGSRLSTSGNWTAPPRYSSNRGSRGGPRKSAPYSRRPYQNATTSQTPPKPSTSSAKPRAPTAQ